jgi:hypothetical protein
VDVSVFGGVDLKVVSAKFSLSVGYQNVNQNTNSYFKVYVQSSARCQRYIAQTLADVKVNGFP